MDNAKLDLIVHRLSALAKEIGETSREGLHQTHSLALDRAFAEVIEAKNGLWAAFKSRGIDAHGFEDCYVCRGAGKVTPEDNSRIKAIENQSLTMQARGYPLKWEGKKDEDETQVCEEPVEVTSTFSFSED